MRLVETRIGTATLAQDVEARAATLTLDWDARCRSRLRATLDDGTEVGLRLPRGTVLRDGDWLVDNDGGFIRVRAAVQAVYLVEAAPETLVKAAYHLGNRHVPVQLASGRLAFEPDPVLARMLAGIGIEVRETVAPFDPEAGAYGGGHRHDADDDGGALGERLSIEAHRAHPAR